MPVTIKTDHKWRDLAYRHDVPAAVLATQFSYLDDDNGSDGFFRYRNYWYHVGDFMACNAVESPLKNWHGYAADSYFSGIVIQLSADGEQVKVGMYLS